MGVINQLITGGAHLVDEIGTNKPATGHLLEFVVSL